MVAITRQSRRQRSNRPSRERYLESLEQRVLLSGIVPDSLVGRETTLAITGGSGIFAKAGTVLFAASSGSNAYYALGITPNVEDSFGAYSYFQTSANTAQVTYTDSLTGITSVAALTFSSSTGGSYFINSSAGQQTGFFAVDPPPAGIAPATDAGLVVNFAISQGVGQLAPAGNFAIVVSPSGTTYQLIGGAGVSSSSGSHTYARTTGATAVGVTNSISTGVLNYELTFTSVNGGTYLVANPSSDSWQIGYFNFAAPAAPSVINAVAQSGTSVRINWTLNSTNETAVNLKRWDGLTWANIATLPAGTTSAIDTGLQPNTPYYYTVSASNSAGETWAPTYVSAVTLNVAPPQSPTNVTATTVSATAVRVNWNLTGFGEAGVYVAKWNGVSWGIIATLPAASNSFIDTNLAPNTTYFYDVVAFNASGTAWATNYAGAMTLGPPAPASNLAATPLGSTGIQVTWTLHGDESAVFVERWNGADWVTLAQLPAGTSFYNDTNLAPNTQYYYEVVTANSLGYSWAPNFASAATFPGAAPSAPTNVTAVKVSSSTIRVDWQLHGGETAVYVAKWNGFAWQIVAALNAGTTTYFDTFATFGGNYYEVIAVNPFGETWSPFYATGVL